MIRARVDVIARPIENLRWILASSLKVMLANGRTEEDCAHNEDLSTSDTEPSSDIISFYALR